jgi:hypothetical protein
MHEKLLKLMYRYVYCNGRHTLYTVLNFYLFERVKCKWDEYVEGRSRKTPVGLKVNPNVIYYLSVKKR